MGRRGVIKDADAAPGARFRDGVWKGAPDAAAGQDKDEGKGEDKSGRRGAFLQLVERAKAVSEAR